MKTEESGVFSSSKRYLSALKFLIGFIALLWLIKLAELLLNTQLYELGVYPRTKEGLIGIIFSPLLHSDIFHLLSNTIPIAIMGSLLILVYRKFALDVFLILYVFSGIILWFVGRDSYHIGASGLVYGLFGFIFFIGLVLKQNNSMLVSAALFFLYGGIFYGVFPDNPEVSWEAHLSGLFVGFLTAIIYEKKYINLLKSKENQDRNSTNFTDTNDLYVYDFKGSDKTD